MLVLGKCRDCGKVKPCIAFPWHDLKAGDSGVDYRCSECDEKLEEWLDRQLTLSRIECEG